RITVKNPGDITSNAVSFPINQATPTITWANPADITYGTPLSATQLDATASVAGSFQYTPGLGTVLHVGASQTLSVKFTPNDTTDYTTASKSVKINVSKQTGPGDLDPGFGTQGLVQFPFTPVDNSPSTNQAAYAAGIDANHNILAAGGVLGDGTDPLGGTSATLARVTAKGTPDSSFHQGGLPDGEFVYTSGSDGQNHLAPNDEFYGFTKNNSNNIL